MKSWDVQTTYGTVRGTELDGARVAKGVPYAAPPVDARRFAAPVPPQPWPGIRDATAFAEPSLQAVFSEVGVMDEHALAGSEDCLYLNVYAPADPGSYPVMVWIHGGGAVAGSPQDCDGTAFAQHGVVVVTIAYRLGALGLLHLPGVFDEEAECNFALLDMAAALQWVDANIAAFDGDPRRVSIAGLSNGGRSVATLLATPSARGLYQQAVVMSGTGAGYLVSTPEEAERVTAAVLAELHLDFSRAGQLRVIDAADIVAAQARVVQSWPTWIPFQVVVDGTVLPTPPIDAIAKGGASDVDLLIGTTHDEWDGFAMLTSNVRGITTPRSMLIDDRELEEMRAVYRALLPVEWSDAEVARHALTSSEYWIPAIRLAEAQIGAGGKAWMYRLDWRLAPRGQGFGAPHALDEPIMSPVSMQPRSPRHTLLATAAGDPGRLKTLAPVLEEMRTAMIKFVVTGEPDEARWPAYDLENRPTFLFDDPGRLSEDPARELRVAWEGLLPFAGGTSHAATQQVSSA
jgi:para-nitrobenzyl esterase